jgi:hypothetical protein
MNEAEAGLAYLREHGWLQVEFGDRGVPGPACLMALYSRKDILSPSTYRVMQAVIAEQYPERWYGYSETVMGFNDHRDTTFADIERVLEKTAVRLDEAV